MTPSVAINPMHAARFLSPRCGAKTRRGTPCKVACDARQRKRCRMHGGSSPGAPRRQPPQLAARALFPRGHRTAARGCRADPGNALADARARGVTGIWQRLRPRIAGAGHIFDRLKRQPTQGHRTMPDQSNRTAVLNEIAFRARRSWRRTGEEYMEAAAALVEARDLCEHGEWGPWLAKTGIPGRTAQRMICIPSRAGIKPATGWRIWARGPHRRIAHQVRRYPRWGHPGQGRPVPA